MHPPEHVTQQVSDRKPMKTSEHGGQKKRSDVDSLMSVIPQVCPRVGKTGEKFEFPFYLKRPGNGRGIDDKEEKIGEYDLALGIDVAIEKDQERRKRMNHEQCRTQNQAIFPRAIHVMTKTLSLDAHERFQSGHLPRQPRFIRCIDYLADILIGAGGTLGGHSPTGSLIDIEPDPLQTSA